MSIRTYSELITIPTFEERFEYLQLKGSVGKDTFGYDRYLNQVLYRSPEWKRLRNQIIIRDDGCDLACDGYDVYGKVLIHHLNPITVEDVIASSRKVFEHDILVCVSHNTHNAIHYGDVDLLVTAPIIRTKNNKCTWRHR